MEQNDKDFYVKALRKELPKYVFKPVPSRIVWFFVHLAVIGLSFTGIVLSTYWPIKLVLSIVAGNSMAVWGFLGHEIIHGTVFKKGWKHDFFSAVCLFHWGLHPKVWMHWHNNKHHRFTQHPFDDPDTFGRIEVYRVSSRLRILERIIPGSNTVISSFFLFWFFSFHVLWITFFNPQIFPNKGKLLYYRLYSFFSYVLLAVGSYLIGGMEFLLFLWLVPVLVSNFVWMSYVATNHFLNPLTNVNDPLVNTLTVRSVKFIERMHLNFCFHTEHHVFPGVSPQYAPIVADKLKEHWPELYNEMNHIKALKEVFKTPKIYYNNQTHYNPRRNLKVKSVLLK